MRLTKKIIEEVYSIENEKKYPKSRTNHVGVELEFYCNTTRSVLAVEFYKRGLINKVQIGTDRSVKLFPLGFFGHEVRIIDEENNIENTIKEVCDILKKYEARSNRTCGLHIHLDMRNRDKGICFYNMVKSQNMMFKMVSNSRKLNRYCRKNNETEFKIKTYVDFVPEGATYSQARKGEEEWNKYKFKERYKCINKIAWLEHKTLEIRVHHGSVNAEEINNWIGLLTTIANKNNKIEKEVKGPISFRKEFPNYKPQLVKYIKESINKFTEAS